MGQINECERVRIVGLLQTLSEQSEGQLGTDIAGAQCELCSSRVLL